MNSPQSGIDMRDAFFDELYALAKNDPDVVLLSADMGAYSITQFKKDLPKQYINVGIAEQNMVSIAAGLALTGKKVFIYTIIPFVTMRCFEQIKVDLCCMNLPVTIVGVGPGLTYGSDGPTHHATQDIALMRTLPEITILNPSDPASTKEFCRQAYRSAGPVYVRIDKGVLPSIHSHTEDFTQGISELARGTDITIITTGIMAHAAIAIAEELKKNSINAGVADLYRIKPLNVKKLLEIAAVSKRIVTLEENTLVGAMGSAVCETLADNGRQTPVKRIGLPDDHCFECGTRETLHSFYYIDAGGIKNTILQWIRGNHGSGN
ncbi:MAG: hypothetical protein A2219_01790 [Elusimicrobia bacterium RIFOXYA2_FULL_50_26]|nr:MAG: hypothetical protein A2219_01790 [Elusimicrobia bacterium RIFOXYA2_FULL_50_26]OGS24141.1 MAG: hypothetical protein A2314_09510 [Elusimicrobia bacterium RIFOXYB2_FULL_50_12]